MGWSVALQKPRNSVWRFSRRDSVLVSLTALHAALLLIWPVAPVIGLGVWWNSNTVAHNFIHRPFFRSAAVNRLFSAALSVLLGIPQTLWRERHLAHHSDVPWRFRISRQLVIETALVLCLWTTLALLCPRLFLEAYVPGYLAGLGLCAAQGHWEHAGGQPISHYGRLYNFLCLNDGYHAEHHANPAISWWDLPRRVELNAAASRWPALLRWLDVPPLELLERIVLRSRPLQRFVLQHHRHAFHRLLPRLRPITRVNIVGGGLFPRTATILRELLPAAHLTIIDRNLRNLETARGILGDKNVEYRNERYLPGEQQDCDLLVIPLSLEGDRSAIYRCPHCSAVLMHDWIWRRRGVGTVVSVALLKRLNLVEE
jgi:hypothetical protein